MLSGTHKTQTRQTHYYGKTSTEIAEEDIIEKFDDKNSRSILKISVSQFDGGAYNAVNKSITKIGKMLTKYLSTE